VLKISEDQIQKTVMEWVRFQPGLGSVVFHIPNQGKRSMRYGKGLKDMGMRPGVSDLFIARPSGEYHGAWIELKSSTGRVSPEQKLFLSDMGKEGYFTAICWSIEETIDTIKRYLDAL
jgi:hypothetical protein